MGRNFIQMGPKSAHVLFASSGSLVVGGASSNSMAFGINAVGSVRPVGASQGRVAAILGGTGQFLPRGMSINRAALFLPASGSFRYSGTSTSSWVVGTITVQEGTGQTFNVAGTGPTGPTPGGTYDVDGSGASLPPGTSLSTAGLFSVGSGAASTTSGVVFGYNEPPAPTPTPTPSPPPPGGTFATITLNPTSAGTFPYWSGIYPLEGQIPSGSTILSSDDSTLRASVISTWPDGSASVAVVSGSKTVAGSPVPITLQAGAPAGGTNLTTARITALVSNVTVNCGALGTASLSTFTSPTLTWWANERVICAQYRVAVGSDATLEAIVVIHAFASPNDRAFVEVVLENGKINSTSPSLPASKTYTATVSVNGSQVGGSVASSLSARGSHTAFQAWYRSTWVGGDPGVRVTHRPSDMQAHPLFWQQWFAYSGSLAAYASDAYTPFAVGRHAANSGDMGGTGDADWIGPITKWEAYYLQAGDVNTRNAVIQNALCLLRMTFNYRDTTTGIPTDFNQMSDKTLQTGTWPGPENGTDCYEAGHHPAAGLMAFMVQPSPVFIELAQKSSIWLRADKNSPVGSTFGGIKYGHQVRTKAWVIRSFTHAIYITPTTIAAENTWRGYAQSTLHNYVLGVKRYKDNTQGVANSEARLGVIWDYETDNRFDHQGLGILGPQASPPSFPGFQQSLLEHWYLAVELHKNASSKVAATSNQQTAVDIADWTNSAAARYVWESTGGGFRSHSYRYNIGTDGDDSGQGNTINPKPSWSEMRSFFWGPEPVASGTWISVSAGNITFDTDYSNALVGTSLFAPPGGYANHAYYWAGLCAAVERNIPGSAYAWDRVWGNVTNAATFFNVSDASFTERWALFPRNRSRTSPYRSNAITWTMPTLTAGTAVQMPTQGDGSHLAQSIAPSGWSATDLAYPMFENYGSGIFCENYSDAGAWWVTGTGGHVFGEGGNMFFAAGFDFTTNRWIRLDNANGFAATRKANIVASEEDNDGVLVASNDYVAGVSGMPAPQHMYRNALYLPRQFGGGNKGAYVVMAGSGSVNAGDKTLQFAHKMDLETGRWTHLTSNRWTAVMASQNSFNMIENMSDFDPVTGRLYLFPGWFDANTQIPYIDCRSATPKFAWAAQAESITTNVSSQNPIAWIDVGRRLLLIHTGSSGDPGGAQGIWGVSLTGTGGVPTGNAVQLISGSSGIGVSYAQGRWAQSPVDGCWYAYDGDGSNTLKKITPPTGQVPGSLSGTWTYSTVTFTPQGFSMPVRSHAVSTNGHYSRFFYVPALRCFAWIAGVQDRVVLISPP